MSKEAQVLFERGPSIGVATLNRLKALNSLSETMVKLLKKQYESWNEDDRVYAILIKGAGGKAFCAGGDVKSTVLEIMAGRHKVAKSFFRQEYALDHFLGNLRKPHIALIDGIVMGGGAGISMHGPFRIATERTVFAMPECGIGLFPDVGSSHFLPALPGELGTYLALTGTRLKGFQVVEAGLATHIVPSMKLQELEEKLQQLGPQAAKHEHLNRLFSSFQAEARDHTKASGLLDNLAGISECFAFDNMESIQTALQEREAGWAKAALQQLSKGSPLSQKLTLREMREGAGKSLASCLRMEFRMVSHVVDGPSDFQEGIRALLLDKDGKPAWNPPTLAKVTEEMVSRVFAPLSPEQELQFRLLKKAAQSKL